MSFHLKELISFKLGAEYIVLQQLALPLHSAQAKVQPLHSVQAEVQQLVLIQVELTIFIKIHMKKIIDSGCTMGI